MGIEIAACGEGNVVIGLEGGSYLNENKINGLVVEKVGSRFRSLRGYFNAVCSDAPLLYLPAEAVAARLAGSGIDALFRRYGFGGGLRATMTALELDFGTRFLERGTDLLNTLDHPAIEFVVARERDATETMIRLGDMIAANIEFQRQTGFGSDAWRRNCRVLSQMSGLAFSGC